MIRTMFECPDTGKLLLSAQSDEWPGRDDELVSRHCPKCGKLHRFRSADAIVVMEEGGRFVRSA